MLFDEDMLRRQYIYLSKKRRIGAWLLTITLTAVLLLKTRPILASFFTTLFATENRNWVFSGVGVSLFGAGAGLVVWLWGKIVHRTKEDQGASRGRGPQMSDPGFGYQILSPTAVPRHLPRLAHPDTPYVGRQLGSRDLREQIVNSLKCGKNILLLGRRGIGKTREALEAINLLAHETAEPISVLLPKETELDVPFSIPLIQLGKRVVLLLDDIHLMWKASAATLGGDIADPRLLDADFQWKLRKVVDLFQFLFNQQFCVIATSIGEPAIRHAITRHSDQWLDFITIDVPPLTQPQQITLLQTLEADRDVTAEKGANEALTSTNDGTPAGLIIPVIRIASGRRTMDVNTASAMAASYLESLDDMYRQHIAPYPDRQALLRTLRAFESYGVLPLKDVVISFTEASQGKGLRWLRRRRYARILAESRDWITDVDQIVSCPLTPLPALTALDLTPEQTSQLICRVLAMAVGNERFIRSLFHLARLLLWDAGNISAAEHLLQSVLARDRNNPRAFYYLALCSLERKQYSEAIARLVRSTELSPHPVAWSTLSEIYARQQCMDDAIAAARMAIGVDNLNRSLFRSRLGVLLSKRGEYAAAIQEGMHAVKCDPTDPWSHVALAISYDRAGRFEEAISSASEAISLNDHNAVAWQTLGIALHHRGQWERALAAATRATELLRDPSPWLVKGRILETSGKLSEALAAYKKALEIDADDMDSLLSYAIALERNQELDKAYDVINRAVKRYPNSHEALRTKLRLASSLRRTTDLYTLSDLLLKMAPSEQHFEMVGRAFMAVGCFDDSKKAFDEGISRYPNSLRLFRAQGYYALNTRQTPDAVRYFERALYIDPSDFDSAQGLKRAQSALDRRKYAADALRSGIGGSQDIDAWQRLALLHMRAGDIDSLLNADQQILRCRLQVTACSDDVLSEALDACANYHRRNYVRAIELCERLTVKWGCLVPELWQMLSSSKRRSGDRQGSLLAALQWTEFFPQDAQAWYVLGRRYASLRDDGNALSAFIHACNCPGSHLTALQQAVEIYRRHGEVEQGLALVEKLFATGKYSSLLWQLRIELLIEVGEKNQALSLLQELGESDIPPALRCEIARQLQKLGEQAAAERHLKIVLELDPNNRLAAALQKRIPRTV